MTGNPFAGFGRIVELLQERDLGRDFPTFFQDQATEGGLKREVIYVASERTATIG